ncbi:uncharacterized protein LOC126336436 [Schistocerca gregaria]|uniref:uncharacterized protein LOC126336436 n=1 Tax=Schistocerca gregaria TaxID=7010 RepID=UPI00211EEA80|nr:uncharacterized protein LOC126336436 [Schistocerca gregaria]
MVTERRRLQWGLLILFFHNVILSVTCFSTARTVYEALESKVIICSQNTNCHAVASVSVPVENDTPNEVPSAIQDTNSIKNTTIPLYNTKGVILSPQTTKTNVANIPKSITILYNKKKVMNLFADSSIDTLVDFVIDMVKQEITKRGKSQIQIPDIHETFRKRVGPLKVKGTFDAKKGWFKSLSSLYRSEGISVSKTGSILTVTAGVGLKKMVLGYDQYKARFEHIGPKGLVTGEVDHNAVEVKLTVDLSGSHCKIALAGLRFKQLSKLKIHLTGLGKLSWIFSKVVTWITNTFKGKIIDSAERELSENLETVLGRIHCYSSKRNSFL